MSSSVTAASSLKQITGTIALAGAIHVCERYYPAFQFVVWAGKSAAEAMSAAMFDTEGEA